MTKARIFQPSKTAMQSGRAKSNFWRLEYMPAGAKSKDDVMGYNSSSDMLQQIRLKFESKEDAISYAERNGIAYDIIEGAPTFRRGVSYSANFKHDRRSTWTH